MLKAARSVFAERGFKRATIDEIAHRAEFGKGTIYNYFPDGKDEILFAILDDVYDELHTMSKEMVEETDAPTFSHRLGRYVEAFIEYFLREGDLFVILMKEANRLAFGDDPSKANYFKGQYDRMRGVLEPCIAAAIEAGELRQLDPPAVAHMILGNIHGYLRYNCLRQIGSEDSEIVESPSGQDAARFITEMLLYGLAVPGAGPREQTPDVETAEVS